MGFRRCTTPRGGDPRFVHYGHKDEDWEIVKEGPSEGERKLKDGAVTVPDGIQYDRFAVHLLALVKDLYAEIDDLKKQK
ncbi:hypothetical protein [Aminobacter sp. MSH1]|uniref:hypothetical protein n=1 Tax=Aminobacter sp. MSH1 TaxID=374606 RepID=UPI00131F46EE|nr:hypothetical protein [Aminobacter sp. MSH1]